MALEADSKRSLVAFPIQLRPALSLSTASVLQVLEERALGGKREEQLRLLESVTDEGDEVPA